VYFGIILLYLLAFSTAIVLVARATRFKSTPIKPIWATLAILGAVFVAGIAGGIAGRDIHILYWWLLGLPIAAVMFPVIFVFVHLLTRFVARALYLFSKRPPGNK
jgi:hypothetical protein